MKETEQNIDPIEEEPTAEEQADFEVEEAMRAKQAMIDAEIEEKKVQEMYDAAGVKYPLEEEQTLFQGFEGQPPPVSRKASTWKMNSPFVKDPAATQAALANANRWRKFGLKQRPRTNKDIMERIDYYFDQCMREQIRPTIENMSLALGYSRMSVWQWKNGIKCDDERHQIIQAAYDTIAAFDADMAINGAMNPIIYIFRSKNFYDMQDRTEVIVGQSNPLGDVVSVEEIEEKYRELPPD